MRNFAAQSSIAQTNRQRDSKHPVSLYSSSPGVADGHQGDITIGADIQGAVLRLDPDAKELDVLRGVCTHAGVLLHTDGEHIDESRTANLI